MLMAVPWRPQGIPMSIPCTALALPWQFIVSWPCHERSSHGHGTYRGQPNKNASMLPWTLLVRRAHHGLAYEHCRPPTPIWGYASHDVTRGGRKRTHWTYRDARPIAATVPVTGLLGQRSRRQGRVFDDRGRKRELIRVAAEGCRV